MKNKSKLLAAVAIATPLAVAGSLYTVDSVYASEEQGGISQIFERTGEILGVDPTELESALETARNESIDQAVADGEISEEQAAEMKERDFGMRFEMGGHRGRGMGMGGRGVFAEITSEFLGITTDEFHAEMDSYDTVSAIVEAYGENPDELEGLLQEDLDARIEALGEDAPENLGERFGDPVDHFLNGSISERPHFGRQSSEQ